MERAWADVACVGYKSAIAFIALVVFVALFTMGKSTFAFQQRSNRSLFNQILFLSLFLFLNCIAFVIYYVIDQAEPFFAVVLWVTELMPIVILNILLNSSGLRFTRSQFVQSVRRSTSRSHSSTQ